jgi:PTH1 family peptidyl-tRNA hydrolase
MEERYLVVGLGNPGPQYALNRHNAGFMVLDLLAERIGAKFTSHKTRNDVLDTWVADQPVTLAKPRSYMNESGSPVKAVCVFYKVTPDRLVIVHDELDLPYGVLRLKFGGGDNGHNGLKSVSRVLATRDYYRVRLGVGRPPGRQDPAEYVLRDFNSVERKDLALNIDRAADAVQDLLAHGLGPTQNTYHAATPT